MIVYETINIVSVFKNQELLKQLKQLTLDRFSGLSQDLRYFERLSKFKKNINVSIYIAYDHSCPVAWAMLSFAGSQILSNKPYIRHDQEDGVMQIFVRSDYRGQKIASKLVKLMSKSTNTRLCAFVWDDVSKRFYSQFKQIKLFNIEK